MAGNISWRNRNSQATTAAVMPARRNCLSLTALLAYFPPHGSFRQTLGGLVQHAGIAGEVTIAEGLSGQSEAVIPLEILVNN